MVHLYCAPHFQAEKTYTWRLLLDEILGIPYQLHVVAEQKDYRLVLPNGKILVVEDHFFAHLKEGEPYKTAHYPSNITSFFSVFDQNTITALYGTPLCAIGEDSIQIGIDLPASTFFMATRWEENVSSVRDPHGRFPGKASLAYQFGFLERPVVHEWAEYLWQALVHLGYPEQERKERTFQYVLSCDVDHPKLWWKPWDRIFTLLGALKRGNAIGEWQYWWKKGFFLGRDPYDTFDTLIEAAKGAQVQFNFLSERPRHFDCWYDLKHPFVLQLLKKLRTSQHIIGFHPSKEAASDSERFENELNALRNVAEVPILSGRHHYLCFESPHTWQMWEDNGLKMDSTVGYSDMPGFRTGLCIDYPVFNFITRKPLQLREQPLIAMDITFKEYLQLDPVATQNYLLSLRRQVERFNGQFTLLWHNSSLNTVYWEGWDTII
jgi:hypothetical protein